MTYLFLTFIFDCVYRNWFVLAYMDEMCNMLLDTLTIMTHDREGTYLEEIIKERKTQERDDENSQMRQRLRELLNQAVANNDVNDIAAFNRFLRSLIPSRILVFVFVMNRKWIVCYRYCEVYCVSSVHSESSLSILPYRFLYLSLRRVPNILPPIVRYCGDDDE